jgi:uncharacterized membrane protein
MLSLWNAGPAIQIHVIAAIGALVLGLWQFLRPKGTGDHRMLGWTWVALMITVAVTSFFIHTICSFGRFSWIHGLSLFTLFALIPAIAHARAHRAKQHQRAMTLLFSGALLVAGAFTFTPGRIMNDVITGNVSQHPVCPSPQRDIAGTILPQAQHQAI